MSNLTTAELAHILSENPDIAIDNPSELIAGPGELERRAVQREHEMQAAVFAEAERRALVDARWALLFAVPNGGHRNKATAGRMKAEGVRAGVPDIFLAVPSVSKGFHGAFIELKVKHNQPTPQQSSWMALLAAQGYFVCTIWDDPAEVVRVLEWYLED